MNYMTPLSDYLLCLVHEQLIATYVCERPFRRCECSYAIKRWNCFMMKSVRPLKREERKEDFW